MVKVLRYNQVRRYYWEEVPQVRRKTRSASVPSSNPPGKQVEMAHLSAPPLSTVSDKAGSSTEQDPQASSSSAPKVADSANDDPVSVYSQDSGHKGRTSSSLQPAQLTKGKEAMIMQSQHAILPSWNLTGDNAGDSPLLIQPAAVA